MNYIFWKSWCKFPCKGFVLFGKLYVINNISLNCIVYTCDRCAYTGKRNILTPISYLKKNRDNDRPVNWHVH